jgi:hypothetical protein
VDRIEGEHEVTDLGHHPDAASERERAREGSNQDVTSTDLILIGGPLR